MYQKPPVRPKRLRKLVQKTPPRRRLVFHHQFTLLPGLRTILERVRPHRALLSRPHLPHRQHPLHKQPCLLRRRPLSGVIRQQSPQQPSGACRHMRERALPPRLPPAARALREHLEQNGATRPHLRPLRHMRPPTPNLRRPVPHRPDELPARPRARARQPEVEQLDASGVQADVRRRQVAVRDAARMQILYRAQQLGEEGERRARGRRAGAETLLERAVRERLDDDVGAVGVGEGAVEGDYVGVGAFAEDGRFARGEDEVAVGRRVAVGDRLHGEGAAGDAVGGEDDEGPRAGAEEAALAEAEVEERAWEAEEGANGVEEEHGEAEWVEKG